MEQLLLRVLLLHTLRNTSGSRRRECTDGYDGCVSSSGVTNGCSARTDVSPRPDTFRTTSKRRVIFPRARSVMMRSARACLICGSVMSSSFVAVFRSTRRPRGGDSSGDMGSVGSAAPQTAAGVFGGSCGDGCTGCPGPCVGVPVACSGEPVG